MLGQGAWHVISTCLTLCRDVAKLRQCWNTVRHVLHKRSSSDNRRHLHISLTGTICVDGANSLINVAVELSLDILDAADSMMHCNR